MSKRDFLLEIGLEEIPARFVDGAIQQLEDKVKRWLEENNIHFELVTPYATPRRLALLIQGMAEKQEDIKEEVKGPAKKIALDEQGNWSKAAQGFAKSQGVATEDFYFQELKGVEYIYATKEIKGIETRELLPQLQDLIIGMTFPKNMKWGTHEQRFVRPLRWIVALFGQEIIPITITNITSGNISEGHRFLGERIQIEVPSEYEKQLLGQYVIASVSERRKSIQAQITMLAEEKGWVVPVDQELLDEVVHLVEYPTALSGSFDADFLQIPQEVLITSMKENQRYFPVQDQEGKLLPHFITVRNGGVDGEGIVVRGNEKVLRARLADARFFYEEDKKLKIEVALAKLDQVVFHEELGTIGDKVKRIKEFSSQLSTALNLSSQTAQFVSRTAEICKFDLVSQMVYEFPELQGRMGQEYAYLAGEDQEVANAIFEHYLPRFAGDILPASEIGAIVSVADKLDTIVGSFGLGIVPTGSQDPYGLRRQATGIVQIILDRKWELSLDQLFQLAIEHFQAKELLKRDRQEVLQDLQQFFQLRIKNRLQEQGIRYDVIDAVSEHQNIDLDSVFKKAEVLAAKVEEPEFKLWVETFTRVNNLAQKHAWIEGAVNEQLFEKDVERELYRAIQEAQSACSQKTNEKEWAEALAELGKLKAPIDQFFEQVMVMVEDEKIRQNRMTLLQQISKLVQHYADFSKIVFPS